MARTFNTNWLLREHAKTITNTARQNFFRFLHWSGYILGLLLVVIITLHLWRGVDASFVAGFLVGSIVGFTIWAAVMTLFIELQMRRLARPAMKRLHIDAETWVAYVYAQNKRTLPRGEFNKEAFIDIAKLRAEYIYQNRYQSALFLVALGVINIALAVLNDNNYVNGLIGAYVIIIGVLQPTVTVPRTIKRLELLQRRAAQSESGV